MAGNQQIIRVRLDLKPLKRFERGFRAGLRGSPGPVDDFFKKAGGRYLAFAQQRFNQLSRGGGEWPDLAASTKRNRRGPRRGRKGKPRSFSILRDTGTLFNALGRGSPGNVMKRIRNGIRVGIGGGSRHPKAGMSIGQLAMIHNAGAGRNPKRVIVPAQIPASVERGIQNDLRTAIRTLGRQSERR